jgi:hypothetical protein
MLGRFQRQTGALAAALASVDKAAEIAPNAPDIGAERARDVLLTPADIGQLAAPGPAGAWIARGARGWMEFWRTKVGLEGFYPFDLVAARFVMEPSVFFCAAAGARVEEGWAPEWLWPIDSAGLLAAPDDASGRAHSVTDCPRVAKEAGASIGQILNARGEVRGN